VDPVVSAELRKYVRDVALNGRFADRELVGNLFVGIPGGDQLQYVYFA
jgi:hypothetical protein